MEWKIFQHNFENFIEAIRSLFLIATLDGWGAIMFICMNSDYEENVEKIN